MALHEVRIVLTVKIETGDDVTVDVSTAGTEGVPRESVDDDVLDGVARQVRPYVEAFAQQVGAAGLRVVRPGGARQDYRNILAPRARVRSRIGAVNVVTGRVAIDKVPPELAATEPLAEVFRNNDDPAGVKVYLTSPDRVAAAVRLCRRAVEIRGDVRARM